MIISFNQTLVTRNLKADAMTFFVNFKLLRTIPVMAHLRIIVLHSWYRGFRVLMLIHMMMTTMIFWVEDSQKR
ncbi:hypothetical protein CISIN_1g041303mg [Citrus sinensis]|uniref:Uncharacterized protein n=1 Tax=Citrus sinensis TaxID=2711 RepID=A0A067GMM0_CITSI|nr:hypothetical protein CISIN_1g041303mg [Citrus sinensis]